MITPLDHSVRTSTVRRARPKLAFLVACLCLFNINKALSQSQSTHYNVGVARADITPDYPIRQNGFLSRKQESVGVRQRIWAKAIAVDHMGQPPAVLMTVDNLGVPDAITQEVAQRLSQLTGIAIENVSIAASHSHTAPMINGCAPNIFGMPIPEADQKHIDRYTREFTDKLIAVASEALKNRAPSTLHFGIGSAGFAKNRRSATGPVDHDVPVLVVRDLEGGIRAIHANYACHCVTLSENLIGGDWAGYAQEHIERLYPGAVALISIGCGADQNPSTGVTGDRFDLASQQGMEIASEVERVLNAPMRAVSGPLKIQLTRIKLDLATPPTREQLEATGKLDTPVGYHARVQLQKLERGEPLRTQIDYCVQTWSFGSSLAIVFLAGEVVVDYAARLKSELDSQRLWLCAYSNASPCYIPSERILSEGGYEGASAMIYYDQPSKFAPGLENKIVSVVKNHLAESFSPDAEPGKTLGSPPKSPIQSLKTLRVPEGLRAELVVSEPLVTSPVAVSFGPDGKVWVAEMFDYPTGLDGKFQPGGRVRLLESTKGDGQFDKSSIFLDSIPFPTGVTAWRKGVLVCAAPDILYAEDTDGDRRADIVKKLYSGFGTENFQARVNSLEVGLDGWLYGSCGLFGGTIRAQGISSASQGHTEHEFMLGDRDFRIQPDLGLIEAASGRTQQGRVRDDWGNWFGCSNSDYCFHLPLAENYIARNEHVSAPPSQSHVPANAEANKVFPASDKMQLFSLSGTGGQATAACGIGIYRDALLGSEYANSTYTCEPVNLVVHRLKLSPKQSTFSGKRGLLEENAEFLGSTDTWFRPVQARTAPDGSLWVVDMYRFVIEHPHWIPEADLAKLDVRAGHSMGRIYRVRPNDSAPLKWPRLDMLDPAGLVAALDSPSGWQRDMATQLLVWNPHVAAVPLLQELLKTNARPEARLHALCTLDLLNGIRDEDLELALSDKHPGVRRHALRIADKIGKQADNPNPRILSQVIPLVQDEDAQVRLQAAFSLGFWRGRIASTSLANLALQHTDDSFLVQAFLSSLNPENIANVVERIVDPNVAPTKSSTLLKRLIPSGIVMGEEETLTKLVDFVCTAKSEDARDANWALIATFVEALEKIRNRGTVNASAGSVSKLESFLTKARRISANVEIDESIRLKTIGLLARRSRDSEIDQITLRELLGPKNSTAIQMAAATGLARVAGEQAAEPILGFWRSYSPAMKSHVLDLLLSRDAWIGSLLEAMESGGVGTADLNAMRRQRLLSHPNADVVSRSELLLAGKIDSDRKNVLDEYRQALQSPGNSGRGKELFKKNCGTCHRLGEEGYAVGPDLTAVASKSHEFLLQEILDPNRNLDSRYIAYLARTDNGRSVTGLLLAETKTSVTLRGPDAKDESFARVDLEQLVSNRLSLMPEGLEKVLSKQDMSDVLAYLDTWRGSRRVFPGNTPTTVVPMNQVAVLSAQVAELYGTTIAFEEPYKNVGMWNVNDDYVLWNVELAEGTEFDVWLDWACDDSSSGNSFVLESGDQRITGIAESTITWANYLQKKIGTIRLPSGVQRFTLRPGPEGIRGALLDLRAIYLVPAGQPLRSMEMHPSTDRVAVAETAARILDETETKDARMALVSSNVSRAAELVIAMTKDLPFDESEEYRRIPWIWNVAIAAGKQNDTQVLRELLRAALPLPGQPLRDWQAVVIGGGVINGLSQTGHWPRARLKEIMKNETDLLTRWQRCLDLAAKMADDERVRKGTRYDALRIIPLDPTQLHLDQLRKYLSKGVDGELQMGAVSGLGDVDLPVVTTWLKENMMDFNANNRRLAIEALGRNDDRLSGLLDAIDSKRIDKSEISKSVIDGLFASKNPSLRSKAGALLKN